MFQEGGRLDLLFDWLRSICAVTQKCSSNIGGSRSWVQNLTVSPGRKELNIPSGLLTESDYQDLPTYPFKSHDPGVAATDIAGLIRAVALPDTPPSQRTFSYEKGVTSCGVCFGSRHDDVHHVFSGSQNGGSPR